MDATSEDGYELWLRYRKLDDPSLLGQYRNAIHCATVLGKSPIADAIRSELARALPAILDQAVPLSDRARACN